MVQNSEVSQHIKRPVLKKFRQVQRTINIKDPVLNQQNRLKTPVATVGGNLSFHYRLRTHQSVLKLKVESCQNSTKCLSTSTVTSGEHLSILKPLEDLTQKPQLFYDRGIPGFDSRNNFMQSVVQPSSFKNSAQPSPSVQKFELSKPSTPAELVNQIDFKPQTPMQFQAQKLVKKLPSCLQTTRSAATSPKKDRPFMLQSQINYEPHLLPSTIHQESKLLQISQRNKLQKRRKFNFYQESEKYQNLKTPPEPQDQSLHLIGSKKRPVSIFQSYQQLIKSSQSSRKSQKQNELVNLQNMLIKQIKQAKETEIEPINHQEFQKPAAPKLSQFQRKLLPIQSQKVDLSYVTQKPRGRQLYYISRQVSAEKEKPSRYQE